MAKVEQRDCPKRVEGACSVALQTTLRPFSRAVHRPYPRFQRCSCTFSDSLRGGFLGSSEARGATRSRKSFEKRSHTPPTSPHFIQNSSGIHRRPLDCSVCR